MKVDFSEGRVGGFNYEFLRAIGSQAAELGECLSAAKRIDDGDDESWLKAFSDVADRVHERAIKYAANGFSDSAYLSYIRASNYYRTSIFYATSTDSRREQYWRKSRECFRRAVSLNSLPARVIAIPYGHATLPGYFFTGGPGRRPTLLAIGGYDSTAEEVVMWIALAAQSHGWNCLVFEGPGQWGALYDNPGLTMIADYERPVSAAVDFALTLPEVDPERIALVGYSLGGYLAPRAFAHDKRIKACVADSLEPSMSEIFSVTWPTSLAKLKGSEFDAAFSQVAKVNAGARWTFDHGRWALGLNKPSDLLTVFNDYTIFPLAEYFDRPLLNVTGEGELRDETGYSLTDWASRQLKMMAETPNYFEVYMFTAEEGADTHCQQGGVRQGAAVIMSWLENVLGSHQSRATEYISQRRKVIPPNYAKVVRDVYGPGIEDALRTILAKPSGAPLAI